MASQASAKKIRDERSRSTPQEGQVCLDPGFPLLRLLVQGGSLHGLVPTRLGLAWSLGSWQSVGGCASQLRGGQPAEAICLRHLVGASRTQNEV